MGAALVNWATENKTQTTDMPRTTQDQGPAPFQIARSLFTLKFILHIALTMASETG